MEREPKDQVLQDKSFTELVGLKMVEPLMSPMINREMRLRFAEFEQYLDNFDALEPMQKDVAKDCIRYRMALGAINRVVTRPETEIEQDSHRTAIASKLAETAFNRTAKESHDLFIRKQLEEYVD